MLSSNPVQIARSQNSPFLVLTLNIYIYLFFTRTSGRALIPRTAPFFVLTLHKYIYSSQVLKEKIPITGKSTF
jgi:hypothetical protein